MTESNPFAAAIKVLEEKYAKCRTPLGTYAGMEDKADSIEAAIRVLEAAGKVSKDKAIRTFEMLSYGTDDHIVKQIKSLLSALPDKSAEPSIPEGEEPR
jgi:TRAP-type uncharacterized transport system substrate-binding protein